MTDSVKCTDCRHSFRRLSSLPIWGSGVEWLCRREWVEQKQEFDPVKGMRTVPGHYLKCMFARGNYRDSVCGREGKNWEPREKRNFFLYLKRI